MASNDALRKARVQHYWTQSTLAAQLNTTRMTVIRWEQGKTSPGLYFRAQLCKLFSMTEQELGLDQHSLGPLHSPIWQVPEKRNPFFTGREEVLAKLRTTFGNNKTSPASHIQTISGLAGIGKTQVALEYAYRFHQHYSAVIWLRGETRELLRADLLKLATTLRLSIDCEEDEVQMIQAIKLWLETTSNWLLLVDNLEEPALLDQLLPEYHCKGSILITKRLSMNGRSNGQLQLKKMDEDEGTLLLLRRASFLPIEMDLARVPAEQRTLATQLYQELGGLPLALDQAGAYMEETGCDLAGYLERFRYRCSALLSWRSQNPGSYPSSVTESVLLAQESIERQSPIALELLHLCVFFADGNVPEKVIIQGGMYLGPLLREAVADLLSLDKAFAILHTSTLLRRDPESRSLTMHRLVQTILKDQLTESSQKLWVERILQALYHILPASPSREVIAWPLYEMLLPHVLTCVGYVEHLNWGEQKERVVSLSASLLLKCADYLLERARYQEVEALLERATDLSRLSGNSAHLKVTSLRALALLYEKLGRYSEAEHLILQVISMQKQEVTQDNPQLASSLNTLALLSGRQGKYAQAVQYGQQALLLYKQTARGDSSGIAEAFNTLAQIDVWNGHYQDATEWATRSLYVLERNLGSEHPAVAAAVHTLTITCWEQGNYARAGELCRRAYHICEQVLGPDHPNTGYPLHDRALLCKVQGQFAQAEELFQRVLLLWEQTLGPEHPENAEPLKNLGELYLLQQRYSEGEAVIQRALEIYQQNFGPEHSQMVVPLSILAALATEQGHYKQAKNLYKQACTLGNQSLDQEHPHLAQLLHGLGRLYTKQEMYTLAVPLFARALAIRTKKLGELHPDTQLTLACYQTVCAELQPNDCSPSEEASLA